MPKAAQVLAALKRDGWVQIRQRDSHRRLVKRP
jgi:predicted RNA binding protein YcfA (HicA-like mRNA interferase family)